MSSNNKKHLIGNAHGDRVSLFHDGRVKIWSTTHLWIVGHRERPTALGEMVRIRIGEQLDVPGPTRGQQRPDFEIATNPALTHELAATVGADNGTFVQFFHDGTIIVGNDGRDIRELLNAGRRANPTRGQNGVGGSVMLVFGGSYRPRQLRPSDYPLLPISEDHPPSPLRLYPDEFKIESPEFD
ncbi:hypothetical protein [Nocardia anaemiae]|uniref:hypothetical protein n=1 Tax=Nocardia anaemiae TaxID=263910 RepID=UPI000B29DB4D|nr:hypothetical protein [Nocardia anaemiae]